MLIKQNERIERALRQTIFLISSNEITNNHWEFFVEGSQGIIYKVSFRDSGMTCECPDYEQRYRNCKHMFFILGKVAQMNLSKFTTEKSNFNIFKLFPNLSNILSKRITNVGDSLLTSSDDCCVCFESMEKCILSDCLLCKNLFHSNCIKQWLSNSSRKNCPLCRAVWFK